MTHLFDSRASIHLRDTPQKIVANAWDLDSDQRTLILAALDFHCGYGNALLSEVLTLNVKNLSQVINALILWRSMKEASTLSLMTGPRL